MRWLRVVAAVALVGAAACGSPSTAARIFFDLDTGVEVDQVRLEVDVGGVALVTLDVPSTPRGQLRSGQDVVVLFEDQLGGVEVGFVAAGLLAGAEVARGEAAVTLVRDRVLRFHITLSATAGCPAGQHACADACYPNDDAAHCGLSCATCSAPAHGQPTCATGACSFACDKDFTRCGTECVDLKSDARNCNACAHACAANQICQAGECVLNSCPTGQHPCNGTCASDLDPATCGSRCDACPAPPNGSATCDGSACGVKCDGGHHLCNGACVSNASVDTCGARCTPCPAVPNTVVGCNGTNCTYSCASGYHVCGNACVSDLDPDTCGDGCTPCDAPPDHATVTCDGVSCGYACNSGYHDCGGWCQVNGQGCDVCPPCGTGQYCWTDGGVCYTPGTCTSGAECPTGTCDTSMGTGVCLCDMMAGDCRPHESCLIQFCFGPQG
jgi:hypothetical protein